MTLSTDFDNSYIARGPTDAYGDSTTSWDVLYCSHLWANSDLRKAILDAPYDNRKLVKYCYTCRGKVRKYEIRSPDKNEFTPGTHSTPNRRMVEIQDFSMLDYLHDSSIQDNLENEVVTSQSIVTEDPNRDPNVAQPPHIATISHQIDLSFRQKYSSHEPRPNRSNHNRLRKSLKGLGCAISFKLTDSPVKKRTQIQACSISVMVAAIVAISFVLVNFTNPSFTHANNVVSTFVVPTSVTNLNNTSSTTNSMTTNSMTTEFVTESEILVNSTTESVVTILSTESTLLTDVISKIRKNIKTYTKVSKPKEVINRDLSNQFCSCQSDQVCMLDENTGKSLCKKAVDTGDPTGCGGLCALETEACQLVDKARGVRVCRLLSLVTCSEKEWRCRNGLCVSAEARCDGAIHCNDRSDEMHCDCDLTKQFRCGHSISCFVNTKLCDGAIDCWDGFDEVNCTTECPEHQFTCTDGQCIISSRFCDGLADCADSSDEPQGCGGGCGAHEHRCKNQRCIPLTSKCDGQDNCGDSSDELNCS